MPPRCAIVSPHPDDEIFAYSAASHLQRDGYKVTVLLLSGSASRQKESSSFCQFNGWNLELHPLHGVLLQDGKFHQSLAVLGEKIRSIFEKYDLILCPALEGGHHDHDSVSLITTLQCLSASSTPVLFYPTYCRAFDIGPFYNVCSSVCTFVPSLYQIRYLDIDFSPLTMVLCALKFFPSQASTWLALTPILLLKAIQQRKAFIYELADIKQHQIAAALFLRRVKPLYEVHYKCSYRTWLSYVSNYCNW